MELMTQKTKIKPMPGWIVAKPLIEETSAGGFKLPEEMTNKNTSGVVLAVGDAWTFCEGGKEYTIKSKVKVGDKIIFKGMGHQMYEESDGKKVYLLKYHDDVVYSDLLAIIED